MTYRSKRVGTNKTHVGKGEKRVFKETVKAAGLTAMMTGSAMAAEPGHEAPKPAAEPTEQAASPEVSPLEHRTELIKEAHPELSFSLKELMGTDMMGNPEKRYEITINGKLAGFTASAKDDASFLNWVDRTIAYAKAVELAK